MKLLIIFVIGIMNQLAIAAGELTFTSKRKSLALAPDAKKVEVFFPFENKSNDEVVVMRYDAPCTCMSAQLKGGKRLSKDGPALFAPGEKGIFKGVFELGNLKGTIEKKIVIWAKGDPDDAPSIILTTELKIPYLIAAFPQSLTWDLNEEPSAKSISIKVDHNEPIKIIAHNSSNPQLDYTLETLRDGYEYKLTITPKSTKKILFAAIRLTTDSSNQRYKIIQTFVTIKPKKK